MRIAIIGKGYWGTKIYDTVSDLGHSVSSYDIGESLDPTTPGTTDAVIVATPALTHKNIVKIMLRRGMDVLVEKPAFANMAEFDEIEPYTVKGKLMAGHVLLYSDHFKHLQAKIKGKEILHMEHRRLAWGRMQTDVNPILHYAPHDVALLDTIFRCYPDSINCKGLYISKGKQPDYVTCDLQYSDTSVQLQMGWYYHKKVRSVSVITRSGTLDWDDVANKTTWIQDGAETDQYSSDSQSLRSQIKTFVEYCTENKEPVSSLEHIKRVTYIVECMEKSLKTGEVICPSKKY